MMVLCKWDKNEEEDMETGELGRDGTYRSYKVDDISLEGEQLEFYEKLIKESDSEIIVKHNTPSTSSGIGSIDHRFKKSLILSASDLMDQMELFDIEVTPRGMKKDTTEEKIPFLSHLMNFFSNVICGSRPNLNFDTNLTISTIKELPCETDITDLESLSGEINYHDKNIFLSSCDSIKSSQPLPRSMFKSLRKASSLPNIKLYNTDKNNKFESDEESKASALCSAVIIKTLEAHGYFIKDSTQNLSLPQIKITQIDNEKKKKETMDEEFRFLVQIPKEYSHFLNKYATENEEIFTIDSKNIIITKEKTIGCNEAPSLEETQITVKIQRVFAVQNELYKLVSETSDKQSE